MSGVISRLPVVVLNVHTRCNCRCAMCDIWKSAENREMPVALVEAQLDHLAALGVEWVVLSGGEPLMHSDLFGLAAALKSRGIRVTVLTSGLLLERYAAGIVEHVDDVIVSLDGPTEIHDRIRGVASAFERIRKGVEELNRRRPGYSVAARCTVQKQNHSRLKDTLESARELGLKSISFLAVDAASTAFNREPAWEVETQSRVILTPGEIEVLKQQVEDMIASRDPLLADSPDHLHRIVDRFRAYAGLGDHSAPRCNAPWVSAVIEADGRVRPCFFHRPIGRINGDLGRAINGPEAIAFRQSLDVAANEICRRCVCSLYRDDPVRT